MYGKKLLLAAVSSALLIGVSTQAGFAAPGDRADRPRAGMGRPGAVVREVIFVRMLKQFDTNKDSKITKEEAMAGVDRIFDSIDTNHDGSITPGEIRQYRQAQMQKMREGNQDPADTAPAPQADNGEQARPDDAQRAERHMHHWRHGNMMRASLMFRRIDRDENGQISKQEAEAAMERLFTRMDRNKDGVISIDDMPDRPFL
ncbi:MULTISPECIES: EF-hand domain-containing protein [unclassified Sinorhizobium]|uniref:EF-hand domain-containing protein n=1 Tax=unclassified Sinorhizobium TaxID=2613772 RepID=UPI0035237EE9